MQHFLSGMGRFKKNFTDAQEAVLVDYIKSMESRLFGLTTEDLRRLAYQLAEKNHIKHNFKNNIAGLDWLKGFLKRHQDLSLRIPEATSAARAMDFNKTAVSKFFINLINCLEKYKIKPQTGIFATDENVFEEADLVAAETTERDLTEESDDSSHLPVRQIESSIMPESDLSDEGEL